MIAHATAVELRSVGGNTVVGETESQYRDLRNGVDTFVRWNKGGMGTTPGIYPGIGSSGHNPIGLVSSVIRPFHDFNLPLLEGASGNAKDGDNLLSGEPHKLTAETLVVAGGGTGRKEKTYGEKRKEKDVFHHSSQCTLFP